MPSRSSKTVPVGNSRLDPSAARRRDNLGPRTRARPSEASLRLDALRQMQDDIDRARDRGDSAALLKLYERTDEVRAELERLGQDDDGGPW